METAIQKAIEGGYEVKLTNISLIHPKTSQFTDVLHAIPSANDILLDREFWQALGKALGWKYANGRKISYIEYWIDFICHLAKGKTPDEFFNNLLK